MEFGKRSEASLSKCYTVALLYLSAAAAKKMKEAEVVKKKKGKKVGGGEETGKGLGAPLRLRKHSHNLRAHSVSCNAAFTHQSIHTEEGLFEKLKGEKVQNSR